MKIKNLAGTAFLLLASLSSIKADTIASWKYDGQTHAAPYNTNSATTGTGTATVVGMTNTYNGSATTGNADLLATNGASSGTGSKAWRIVGTPTIGWSTNAPIGSQGAQFAASTVGYYQVKVAFDVYATNGAERALLVQYSFDNTSNWFNATNLASTGIATVKTNSDPNNNLAVGSYLSLTNGWNNNITANLVGIPGVDHNTNLLIRLVNAATGTNCLTTTGTNYNNNSGYWGFDNVTITGVAFDTAAKWTFESTVVVGNGATLNFNPVPEFGSGTAIVLGMDTGNAYFPTGTTTNAADVLGQPGSSSNPANVGAGTNCWRIRAASNNGWNSAAPIATQGAEFDVSTANHTNVVIGFDIYNTTQGEAKMCVQYTTDGTTWVTASNVSYAGKANLMTNNPGAGPLSGNTVTGPYFYANKGNAWFNTFIVDLTGVAEVNQNPNFKFRIVNAATGVDCVNFTGGAYNNSSGNFRCDNVFVGGQYAGLLSPALTNQANASVDAPFTNTFADDSAWRSKISAVYVNGSLLSSAAYTVTAGKIVFNPTNSVLLQSSGSKLIAVDATNYSETRVTQPLATGVAVKLALITQPSGPSASGGTLVANPLLGVTDKWGNGTATAPNTNVTVTASVGGGVTTWALGGSIYQASVGGYMTFSNLNATVTGSAAVTGAYITFTVSNYNGVGSANIITNSSLFNIAAPTVPFTSGNLAVLQLDSASAFNTTFSVIEVNPALAGQTNPVSITPVSATGTNAMRLANTGSIGRLALSDDGTLLCFAAYMDDNSANPDETQNLNRGAGTLNYTNRFALPMTYTAPSPISLGGQPRSCATFDNVNFIVCDKGGLIFGQDSLGNGGVFNNNNNVVVRSFGGHGYVLTQKTSTIDPYNAMYGFDITESGPTVNPSFGYPLPNDQNAQDFYLISADGGATYGIVYILDNKNQTGIITKYSRISDESSPNGFSWTANGSITNKDGGDSLFVTTNGSGGAYLYYTTSPSNNVNNSIVRLTDSTGFNSPLTITSSNVVYTASGGVFLKGLTFVPQQTANSVELTPPPVLIAAAGATTNYPFSVALSPDDSTWRSAITGITVNGNNLTSGYTVQAGAIVFDPSQSTLLSPGAKTIVVNATGYSPATVMQTISVVYPITLGGVALSGGKATFSFTNSSGLGFSVLATNDLTAPIATWPVVGTPVEGPAGTYNYTNSTPATNGQQFYILRQP